MLTCLYWCMYCHLFDDIRSMSIINTQCACRIYTCILRLWLLHFHFAYTHTQRAAIIHTTLLYTSLLTICNTAMDSVNHLICIYYFVHFLWIFRWANTSAIHYFLHHTFQDAIGLILSAMLPYVIAQSFFKSSDMFIPYQTLCTTSHTIHFQFRVTSFYSTVPACRMVLQF